MKNIIATLLLLYPFFAFAKSEPRTKYNVVSSYQYVINDYITRNPEVVVTSPKTNERLVFLKKYNYTSTLPDTLAGMKLVFIDPTNYTDSTFSQYFKKKQKLTILDMQQCFIMYAKATVWLMPINTNINPKKKTIAEPEYAGSGCGYLFDYLSNLDPYYLFKSVECKTLE